jgi:hypothetical protein
VLLLQHPQVACCVRLELRHRCVMLAAPPLLHLVMRVLRSCWLCWGQPPQPPQRRWRSLLQAARRPRSVLPRAAAAGGGGDAARRLPLPLQLHG